MKFLKKTVILTGAGQGIGFEIARQLALEGAQVLLNDIDPALAEQAAQKIRAESGGVCIPLAGDSGDPAFIQEMVAEALAAFGGLDIVVANAGITLFGDFFNYSPEAFSRVMQVNLAGTFFLAQAAARVMKNQPAGGTLLLMSSVTGRQAHKDLAAYSMSKAAIDMLAKNLVIELSPFKININTLAPGATLTERTLHDPEYTETWSRLTPMGRPANVSDIAAAALFLVSEQAKQITGHCLVVDGGWSCISPNPM